MKWHYLRNFVDFIPMILHLIPNHFWNLEFSCSISNFLVKILQFQKTLFLHYSYATRHPLAVLTFFYLLYNTRKEKYCRKVFSTLWKLKMYLRNTMGQTRLNGLTLLNIPCSISATGDEEAKILVRDLKKKLYFIL